MCLNLYFPLSRVVVNLSYIYHSDMIYVDINIGLNRGHILVFDCITVWPLYWSSELRMTFLETSGIWYTILSFEMGKYFNLTIKETYILTICQAIIWTNAEILLIGPLGTNYDEMLIKIQQF